MTRFPTVLAAVAALAVLASAAAAAVAEAPAARPLVKIAAHVSPNLHPFPKDVPLMLRLSTSFSSVPAGGDLVLERADYLFGRGARFNGALFPSCSAQRISAAHGNLRVCPRGSKVGTGVATGRALAVGITSSGKLTVFNGPGGKSLTLHFLVINPALIDATFSAPIRRLHGGRYAFKLSTAVPPDLQSVLDGDIVVQRLDVTAGATRVIDGRRRGYFEAAFCPRHGGSAIHGDFFYKGGAVTTADATVPC